MACERSSVVSATALAGGLAAGDTQDAAAVCDWQRVLAHCECGQLHAGGSAAQGAGRKRLRHVLECIPQVRHTH